MSVKDFDPRYLTLWRDASIRDVILPVDSREQAINFRQRLYLLRKAMKNEGHAFAEAAARAKIKLEYNHGETDTEWHTYTNDKALAKVGVKLEDCDWRLRMVPYDQSYDEILEKAGYGVPEAPELG